MASSASRGDHNPSQDACRRLRAKAEARCDVCLDTGDTVEVDHILYATGYKINLRSSEESYRVQGSRRGSLCDL